MPGVHIVIVHAAEYTVCLAIGTPGRSAWRRRHTGARISRLFRLGTVLGKNLGPPCSPTIDMPCSCRYGCRTVVSVWSELNSLTLLVLGYISVFHADHDGPCPFKGRSDHRRRSWQFDGFPVPPAISSLARTSTR